MKKNICEILDAQNLLLVMCMMIALVTGVIAIFILPSERHIDTLFNFLFKLLPFIFGAITISLIKKDYCVALKEKKLAHVMLVLAFLVYFCFFVPRIFFNLVEYGMGDDIGFVETYHIVYYYRLMEVPYIILAITFAFKLGGASISNTLRAAFSLLAVMLSGIEDLAYFVANSAPVPDVWDWASHMRVRLGFFPTRNQAYVFIVVHLLIAALIAFAPWGKLKPYKWFDQKYGGKFS